MPKDTIIYIPIEAPKRELTSKTMLATRLAKAGYTTILFEHSFFDRHKWKMPGLYLGKNFFRYEKSKTNKSHYNEMKKSKIDIWYLDEEAGIFPGKDPKSWKIFLDERIDINNLSSKDKILVWGRWQKEHWIEKTNKHEEKNIIITGTPHYDMLQTKYHKYFREFDLNTTGNLENYILINTRFSLVNSHPRLGRKAVEKFYLDAEESFKKFNKEKFSSLIFKEETFLIKNFIELAKYLSENFTDKNIVLRAHPDEGSERYKNELSAHKNIKVISEGGIDSWIRLSDCVIHNGCSTAIQADFAKKKVISYLPSDGGLNFYVTTPGLPNMIGFLAKTNEDVKEAIKNPVYKQSKQKWESTFSEENTIEKIASMVEEFYPEDKTSSMNIFKNLKIKYFMVNIKEFLKDILRPIFKKPKVIFPYEEFYNIMKISSTTSNIYDTKISVNKLARGAIVISPK